MTQFYLLKSNSATIQIFVTQPNTFQTNLYTLKSCAITIYQLYPTQLNTHLLFVIQPNPNESFEIQTNHSSYFCNPTEFKCDSFYILKSCVIITYQMHTQPNQCTSILSLAIQHKSHSSCCNPTQHTCVF